MESEGSNIKHPTVQINGIDLFSIYRSVLTEKHSVQPPVLKSFFRDIPGADGAADLSTVISGRPTYERRQITMNFQSEYAENQWAAMFSEIMKEFHGKEGKIIFGDNPDYYYFGRMEVSGYERIRTTGKFTITANADPYKYEMTSSLEPWRWDSFNFRNGIIRSYGKITVNGSKILNIHGLERWVVPVFIVEGNVRVSFEDRTYDLKPGTSKIYAIAIKPGENILKFDGTGTVSVDYRGGKL